MPTRRAISGQNQLVQATRNIPRGRPNCARIAAIGIAILAMPSGEHVGTGDQLGDLF
jgi:hypothetical protein